MNDHYIFTNYSDELFAIQVVEHLGLFSRRITEIVTQFANATNGQIIGDTLSGRIHDEIDLANLYVAFDDYANYHNKFGEILTKGAEDYEKGIMNREAFDNYVFDLFSAYTAQHENLENILNKFDILYPYFAVEVDGSPYLPTEVCRNAVWQHSVFLQPMLARYANIAD